MMEGLEKQLEFAADLVFRRRADLLRRLLTGSPVESGRHRARLRKTVQHHLEIDK